MTPINNLKQWFRNGLKPTQEQFWAWMDSFWHKDEKIPMQNIEGIDTALENKAETTTVEAKANKDATGLDDDDIIAWKEALGVGELPSNIAKIDTDSEQGNVYDKTQVDDLLENSGKNIGNSDLETTSTRTFTQAHIFTHNTAGYHYYITGLPDKSADSTFNRMRVQNADGQEAVSSGKAVMESLMDVLSLAKYSDGNYNNAFSEYLIYNPTTRQLAKSDRPQIVSNFNVPSNLTINHSINNDVINLIYNGGEPNIPDNIRQAMERIKQIEQLPYTFFKSSDLVISTMPKSEYPESIRDSYTIPNDIWEMQGDGVFAVKKTLNLPSEFSNDKYYFDNRYFTVVNAQFNVELPSDKDWIIAIQAVPVFINLFNAMSFEPSIGIHKSSLDNDSIAVLHHTVYRFTPAGQRNGYGLSNWTNSEIFFIKTGDIVTIFIRNMFNGNIETSIIPYKDRYKYLTFKVSNNGLDAGVFPNALAIGRKFVNMRYWIQN